MQITAPICEGTKGREEKVMIGRIFVGLLVLVIILSSACDGFSNPTSSPACAQNPEMGGQSVLIGTTYDWRPQDYEDSQGVTRVQYDPEDGSLILDCALKGKNANRAKGEIVLDLKYVPGFEGHVPFDMTAYEINIEVKVPSGFVGPKSAPNGCQVFVKDSESRSQYGTWMNCNRKGIVKTSLQPSSVTPRLGLTAEGFDPSQITSIGVKMAINEKSRDQYDGELKIKCIKVTPSPPFTFPVDIPSNTPTSFVTANAEVNRAPDGFYINDKKWFVLGGNWRMIEYGQNFGSTGWFPWGNGISKHPGYIQYKLDLFRRSGITLVRIGLLDDGRAMFDDQGNVTGFADTFKADVSTFLDMASRYNMKVEFVLVDFMLAGKGENVDGVWVGGRKSVIENSQTRAKFINQFLVPFLNEFGNHPAIFGFDVINEPEWIIAKTDGGGWEDVKDPRRAESPVSSEAFDSFLSQCAQKIRDHAPDKFVTVGVSFTHIDLIRHADIDYYALHYYPWMGTLEDILAKIPKDKPWIVEELPGKGNIVQYCNKVFDSGGSGVLVWNLSPGIDDQSYGFAEEENKLKEIRSFAEKVANRHNMVSPVHS